LINIVGDDGDPKVVKVEDFDPSGGERVLKGQRRVANDLESDDAHTTLRQKGGITNFPKCSD
jgi:hypothetical protein